MIDRQQPDESEWLRVSLHGREYRLIYRLFVAARQATCVVELLTPDGWQERYGTTVKENEQKFSRGMSWVQRDAHEHGTPQPLPHDVPAAVPVGPAPARQRYETVEVGGFWRA